MYKNLRAYTRDKSVYTHNTKPEVDIMRNGNKTRQLLSLARIFVLALCFTLVFAVVLTVTFGAINGVAFASTQHTQNVDGESTFGKANPISADNGYATIGDFKAINSSNKWEGTKTFTYYNVVSYFQKNDTPNADPNDDQDKKNNVEIYKKSGDTDLFLRVDSQGRWEGGVTNGAAKNDLYMVLNFELGEFLNGLLATGNVVVDASITANYSKNSEVNNIYTSAVAGPNVLTGQKAYQLNNGGDATYAYSFDNNTNTLTNHTRSVTLTKDKSKLALAFGVHYPLKISRERYMMMENISITYTIRPIGNKDGGAPIVTNKYDGIAGEENINNYAPYILNTSSSENQGKFPLYYDSIKNKLKTDSIVNGSGTLASYTSSFAGTIPGTSTGYYKFAQTEFVDTFNYTEQSTLEETIGEYGANAYKFAGIADRVPNIDSENNLIWDAVPPSISSDGVYPCASGLATVQVGNTTFNLSNVGDVNALKEIKVTDTSGDTSTEVSVGYATVTKTNRARVVVTVYLTANCKLKTTVTDNGGDLVNTNITVSGIDTKAPDTTTSTGINLSSDNFMNTDATTLAWLRQNGLDANGDFELLEEKDANYSPYIWFYTVNRADNLAALNAIDKTTFADYNAVKAAGIQPIAVDGLYGFYYDFKTGKARTIDGKVSQTSVIKSGDGYVQNIETGHGYYRFTFYTFDLAGNMGEVKSYYVKVDYDTPTYTLDFSYDKNGTQTSITAAENGKKWATGDVTLKFTLTAGGFSGYTFRFNDVFDAMHALVFNGVGEYNGDVYVPTMLKHIQDGSSSAVVDNKVEMMIGGVNVTITLSEVDNKNVITFKVPSPTKESGMTFYEWVSLFTAYEGQFDDIGDIDSEAIEYTEAVWSDGVKVLIDSIAPIAPTFFEEEEAFLKDFGEYVLPTSRNWFHSAKYELPVKLAFSDSITATDYVNGLKIHYGVKVVKNMEELKAFAGKNVENKYRTAIDIQKELGLDRYIMKTGDYIVGDATDFDLQLLQNLNAGMRLIYVWAEDQAGNVSELSRYYVLADANTYSVSAAVKGNSMLENGFATLAVTDAEGNVATTIRRGETLLFNIGLANTYVPFKFTQNGNVLLENYTKDQVWNTIENSNTGYIDAQGYATVRFTLDDFDNLSDLNKTNKFELSARKVITYNYINSNIGYTAAPTDVSSAVVIPEYESAKSSLVYRFVDAENNLLYVKDDGETTIDINEAARDTSGNPVYFVPTKVGNYHVRIYIPKENDSFITSDFAMNEGGEQLFEARAYNIIRGKAVITVKPSTSKFGEPAANVLAMLDFDVTGIDKAKMASEKIFVNLVLKEATPAAGETFNVGSYTIVNGNDDYSAATNYDVTFRTAIHSVTRRQVVIDAWGASKKFGDSDPEFKFGVELAQFANLYKSEDKIVADIFKGYRKDDETIESGYALYFAEGRITREPVEGVGQYDFDANAALFDVDENYSILVQTAKYKFTIEKRIVKLDVSGQSSVFPFGTDVNAVIGNIAPTYKISATDMVVASTVEALFADGAKLALAVAGTEFTAEGYSAAYKYAIELSGKLTDGNVEIQLGETGAEYIVYVTEQSAIVIKVKDGVKYEFVYGFAWGDDTLAFDSEKFDVQGTPSGDYTAVKWTVVGVASGEILHAGKYVFNIVGAKLYNGETALADAVFVEPVTVTVNPATIVVKPTAQKLSKVYGEEDGVYGIGFEIASVNAQNIAKDGTYASIAYNDILDQINGAFVRAIYKDSTRLSFASRYDDATDSTGAIFNSDGRYYGFAAYPAFGSKNPDFTVEADVDFTQKLAIEQRVLNLSTKDFVGVGKAYDNNTNVYYNGVKRYDLTSLLALATDDVLLQSNANYDSAEAGSRNITFDTLSLSGAQAHNYKLGTITNDGNGTTLNGATGELSVQIDGTTTVTIIYIDNTSGNNIIISAGVIELLKTDVKISKQYDNTKNLVIDNISFVSGAGTNSLIGATKTLIAEESDSYTGSAVNSNYVVNVAVFFEFSKPEAIDVKTDGIYENSDIIISKGVTYNNKIGIKIVFKNMPASITKRILGKNSFETLAAVNRDYNTQKDVDMTYTFSQNALAEGDTAQTVGLKLAGAASKANAGTHSVSISAFSVLDNNYDVDINAINTAYTGIYVEISKARLVPNVKFADKEYDGTSSVTAGNNNGTFTSVQYATNLAEELKKFSYDASKVRFALSLNGQEDSNVGANGKHNVMIGGLEVTFSGTAAEKEQMLQNYVLDGSRYSKVDNKYNKINALQEGVIDDFELIDAVNMSKKKVQLIVNDFDIKDKIYDGTTSASITINITDGRIVAEHSALLEVVASGNFARKQRGNNIIIDISAAMLKVRESLSQEQATLAQDVLKNYELLQYKGTVTGNIKPRPVVVSADLGTREYNGDEAVAKSGISYELRNMIEGDIKYYAIQTKNGAYFDDKNVAAEIDTQGNVIKVNAKGGTAYGLLLQNIKERYDNYTLVYSSNSEIAGKEALAYVLKDGTIVYEKPLAGAEVTEYWYALETTRYYVAATNENRTKYKDAIVGFYKVNGLDALMLERAYGDANIGSGDENIKAFDASVDAINYLRAQGKITQRTASIRASGIERLASATAFEKIYDGTDIFYGEAGKDFNFTASAVSNVMIGDDVTIANVSAKFDSAFTTAKYVVFTASGIAGADAYNYTIAGDKASVEVRLSGKIHARSINAYLADAKAEYGVSTGKYSGNVEYKLVGNDNAEYELDNRFADDTAFYITTANFLAATGLDSGKAMLLANASYNLVDGKYVKAAEGSLGEYIRLGEGATDKIGALPQAYVSFAATTPEAGTTSTSYVLKGGTAKNYEFKPVYTDKGSVSEQNGTTSVMTVVKKDLFILTVSNGFSVNYGAVMNADGKLLFNVGLRYLDAKGGDGIIGGQSVNTLFTKGGRSFLPTVRLGIYNALTGVTSEANQLAKTSDKLGENEYYVLYVVSDHDYDTLDTIVRNYNVVLAGIDTVSSKPVDGKVRTIFDIAGASVKFDTATLDITLPKLTGVSVGSDSENEFSYSYAIDKNGKGINRLHDVVQGELGTDEVIFVDDAGSELYPVNVGTYSGTVMVRRYINANGEFVSFANRDANGYCIEWNSGDVKKSIVINKADVNLRAQNVSEYYNGEKHEYATAGSANRVSYNALTDNYNLVKNVDYTIAYEALIDGNYAQIDAKDVLNAGKYRVTVKLTDTFLNSPIGKNYKAASTVAELQVLRAIVNVSISADGYTQSEEMVEGSTVMKLTGEFTEGKKYSIGYSVAMSAATDAEKIAIDKSQTKLVGLDTIASAGKYSFAVVLADSDLDANNYVFMSSTGILELTTRTLAASDGSSIEITEGKGIVANRLEVKEIKTNNALASDMSYLQAVEQYVAAMSKKAGIENARVAAALRVNLYLDNQLVLLSNTPTTVTVALPESVKNLNGIAIYYVNENGGLTKLTDYQVNDGKLTYSANYVNGIVFVDVTQQTLETWKICVIAVSVAMFVLIVVATVVSIVVKKSKLKKLA